MLFHFGLKSALLLIFFFHGVIFSALLLLKGIKNNDKPSYWLSFFILLCALYISPFMLGYAGWYSVQPYRGILFYLPLQHLFLLPPVLYIYYCTLLDKSFHFQKKTLLHFLPGILYLLYSLVIFIYDKVVLGYPYFYHDERDKDFDFWYQLSGFFLLFAYLVKILMMYRKYKILTFNTISYAESMTFKWAQNFLITLLVLLCLRGIFFVVNPEWDNFGRKFWYYLLFSLLYYYISIAGYVNSLRSITSFGDWSKKPANSGPLIAETHPEKKQSLLRREKDSGIPDLDDWKKRIETLMVIEKLYENPELSISDISRNLGTHSKKISQVINQGFNLNFNDFVNRYRVEAIIRKMEGGEHSIQTLLGIAYDCGFNSKSTFNRVFKKHTSHSPIDFIQKFLKK